MKKTRVGFTIVELLVVIVVIAILAAMSIVAYTQIQERALNTARNTAARQTLTILQMYKTEHGSFPQVPLQTVSSGATCLGGDWPVRGAEQVCWNIYDDGEVRTSTYQPVESVITALEQVGSLPDFPQKPVWTGTLADGGAQQNGLVLYYRTADSPRYSKGYSLLWTLPEGASCDVSGAIARNFGYSGNDPVYCTVSLGE